MFLFTKRDYMIRLFQRYMWFNSNVQTIRTSSNKWNWGREELELVSRTGGKFSDVFLTSAKRVTPKVEFHDTRERVVQAFLACGFNDPNKMSGFHLAFGQCGPLCATIPSRYVLFQPPVWWRQIKLVRGHIACGGRSDSYNAPLRRLFEAKSGCVSKHAIKWHPRLLELRGER